jgi:hypothetical protein
VEVTDAGLDLSISPLLLTDEGDYRYSTLLTDGRLDLSISPLFLTDEGKYRYTVKR